EDKIAQMYSVIQTGMIHGMQTMDQCLKQMVSRGLVSAADAKAKAMDPNSI
ncbi:MAG: twitching motility protein PilT, partial [Aeromonadaceae bacterium]